MAESSPIKISGDIPSQELSAVILSSQNKSLLPNSVKSAISSLPSSSSGDGSSMPTQNLVNVAEVAEVSEVPQQLAETEGKFVPTIKAEEGYKTASGLTVETVQESKFLEALQSYFKIKNKYDTAYEKKKNKIVKSRLSINEKRERIQKIRSNCILCKKSVGTIFSNKNKHYKAICGSKESPCKLNIDLIAGNVVNIEETLKIISDIYENEVEQIMKTKLDLLFNFKSEEETLQQFEELNISLKSNNKILKHYRDLQTDMKNNEEKQEDLDRITSSIDVLVDDFKQNIDKYRKERKLALLKDTMTDFTSKLMPLLNERRKAEYVYQAIEFDESDETYNLVQRKYLPNKLEDVVEPSSIVTNNS
tara:strand:- start:17 stop:1105 length:1089 start_codon:yes stop_codon:yes gene_type:complete